MPTAALTSLAEKNGVSVQKAEELWNKAKDIAAKAGQEDNYAYITGIVKKMMGETETAFVKEIAATFAKEIADAEVVEAPGTYAAAYLSSISALQLYDYFKTSIGNLEEPEKFHVTTVYSTAPVTLKPKNLLITLRSQDYEYDYFGDTKNVLVMKVRNPLLDQLYQEARDAGASWDHPDYVPHITLSSDYDNSPLPELPSFDLYLDRYDIKPLEP